jgi:hypothetical protein
MFYSNPTGCTKMHGTTDIKFKRSYIQMALKRFELVLDVLIIPKDV